MGVISAGIELDISRLAAQLTSTKSNHVEVIDFMVKQFLEQSGVGSQNQRDLMKLVEPIIESSDNFEESWTKAKNVLEEKSSHLGKQFDEFSYWFTKPEGINFIEKDLKHAQRVDLTSIPRREYVSTNYQGAEVRSQVLKNLQEQTQWGKNINVSNVTEHHFDLLNQKQSSRVINASIKIPGLNQSIPINLYQPSELGFIANATASTTGLTTPSESLYAAGKRFVTDVASDGSLVFANSYDEFQTQLLNQLQDRIKELRADPRSVNNPALIEERVRGMVKKFDETLKSQQHFAGTAAELQGTNPIQGTNLSRIVAEQEKLAVVPSFSKNTNMFTPGNKELLGKIINEGFEFPLSSGQTGNTVTSAATGELLYAPKALSNAASYDPGYPFPSFREPHKQMGLLQPLEALQDTVYVLPETEGTPRIGKILEGAFEEGVDDFTKQNFNPKGVNTIVGFAGNIKDEAMPIKISLERIQSLFPDKTPEYHQEIMQKFEQSTAGSNIVMPDGMMIAKDTLARDVGSGYMRSETIKTRGPGSHDFHRIGKSLSAFIEGGEIPYQLGEHKVFLQVKGFKQAQGVMTDAMEIINIRVNEATRKVLEEQKVALDDLKGQAQKHLDNFGFPLEKGQYLGLDNQGYQVSTENRVNTRSYVHQATLTDEGIQLRLFQTTEQAIVDGQAVNQVNKLTGGALNKGRVSVSYATSDQFARVTGIVDEVVESALPAARLVDPLERTFYQGATARQAIVEFAGKALNEASEKGDDVLVDHLAEIRNLSTEEVLSIAHGQAPKTLTTNPSNVIQELLESQQELLKKAPQNASAEYKLSQLTKTIASFTGQSDEVLQQAVERIYAPHTQWGKMIGFDQNPNVYTSWGEGAKHVPTTEQQVKTELAALLGKDPASAAAASDEVLQSKAGLRSLVTFGITDEGTMLGMGQKGTIEPRLFDIAKTQEYLRTAPQGYISPFEEISLGMTNYMPAIEELDKAIQGHTADNTVLASQYKKSSIVGKTAVNIDLGIPTEHMDAINDALEAQYGHKRFQASSSVYMPAEEHLTAIGKMQGGLTLEKDKPIRNVYSKFVETIESHKRSNATPQEYAHAFANFHQDLQAFQKVQVMGEAGGGMHGMLRGPVHGSAFLYNTGYSADLQEALGLIDASDPEKYADEFFKTQQKSFVTNTAEQGIGRQVFVTEKAGEKLFTDKIQMVQEQMISGQIDENLGKMMIADLEGNLARLKTGEGVGSLLSGHPMINTGSVTPTTMYLDRASNYAKDVDAIATGQEFATIRQGGKSKQVGFSTLPDMARDHDGDRLIAFALGEQNSQAVSKQMSSSFLKTDLRSAHTAAIKAQMVDSTSYVAERLRAARSPQATHQANLQSTIDSMASASSAIPPVEPSLTTSGAAVAQDLADTIPTPVQAVPTAAMPDTMTVPHSAPAPSVPASSVPASVTANKAVSAAAKASPKTVVPRISNTLSEMKYALMTSGLKESNVETAFNFLYAAEQVPISGKHFVQQAEFGDEVVSRFQNIRRGFLDPTKYESSVDDMMKLMFSDKEGNMLADFDVEYDYRGQTHKTTISAQQIRDDLVTAAKNMHANEKNVDVLKTLRSKASLEQFDQNELTGLYKQLGQNLEGVHYRAEELSQLGDDAARAAAGSAKPTGNAAQQISQVLADQNAATIKDGMSKAGKSAKPSEMLKNKNLAIAAGMLAVGGAALGMTLSPTYVNKREHYIDPDFLFPEEFDTLDPQLHSKGLITPSAVVASGNYQASVHLPPSARIPENMAGRLAMMGGNTASSLSVFDHRMSLDAHKIDKIKREII